MSPYNYSMNNLVMMNDPSGKGAEATVAKPIPKNEQPNDPDDPSRKIQKYVDVNATIYVYSNEKDVDTAMTAKKLKKSLIINITEKT